MPVPLAYLLSWRTYGTWLPGDERGYITDGFNKFGSPYAPPSEARHEIAEEIMNGPRYVLDDDGRTVVDQTLRDHCEIKRWRLHAINIRTNHAHVVVGIGGFDPDLAIGQFKSWSTRRLRAAALAGRDADLWARRGSTRFLWDDDDIDKACHYVRLCQ